MIELAGSEDPLFDSIVDQVCPMPFMIILIPSPLLHAAYIFSFQFSTLDFNSRRARTLLDPYPDSCSDELEPEGPSTNLHNSGISEPRAPDDSRAQEAPPAPPPSVLALTAQEPFSAQAVTATGTNVHSRLLPTSTSSHVQVRPEPSASALSYRSGTKAKSPQRHVSFSFDGGPPGPPTSPQFLASSSLALSPPIPLAAPDSDLARLPQVSPLETSTPATPARRMSNLPTSEGSRDQFRFQPGDEHLNPFIDVINDVQQHRNGPGDEEEEEDEDELDELDDSHSTDGQMVQDHHPLPPLSLPSSYNSSRRSGTPSTITISPRKAPQPAGPPSISSVIEEDVIGLSHASARSTSRSVILCDTDELCSNILITFLIVVGSPAPISCRNLFLRSLLLLAAATGAGTHFSLSCWLWLRLISLEVIIPSPSTASQNSGLIIAS